MAVFDDRGKIDGMFGAVLGPVSEARPVPSLAEIVKAFSNLPKDGKPAPYILGPRQREKP